MKQILSLNMGDNSIFLWSAHIWDNEIKNDKSVRSVQAHFITTTVDKYIYKMK